MLLMIPHLRPTLNDMLKSSRAKAHNVRLLKTSMPQDLKTCSRLRGNDCKPLPVTDLVNWAAYPCSLSRTSAAWPAASSGRSSPRAASSLAASFLLTIILSWSVGSEVPMCRARIVLTERPRASVPHMPLTSLYAGWCLKNSDSAALASRMERRWTMSCWQRLMTPMYPRRSGTTSPRR